MAAPLTVNEEAQLLQTIEMFEVITQSQPQDYQSLEILKEAYFKLSREKDVVATSKRIAQAYVQFGQLSSAILEYESILQRFPDDPDVRAALAQIESKANSFAETPAPVEAVLEDTPRSGPIPPAAKLARAVAPELEDGRQMMYKIFVEGKIVSATDFNQCWVTPDINQAASQMSEPFIQLLADKGICPVDKALKLMCDKARLSYIPLEKYDLDIELARSFPRDSCCRWCVLPFDRMSKSVLVATANPFNKQAVLELESTVTHRLLWYLTTPVEILKMLKKAFR